jgi:hypothetical protein
MPGKYVNYGNYGNYVNKLDGIYILRCSYKFITLLQRTDKHVWTIPSMPFHINRKNDSLFVWMIPCSIDMYPLAGINNSSFIIHHSIDMYPLAGINNSSFIIHNSPFN